MEKVAKTTTVTAGILRTLRDPRLIFLSWAWPMACVICHPFCGSGAAPAGFCRVQPAPGIRAAGVRLQAGLSAGPHCDVDAAPRSDAMPMPPLAGAGNLSKLGWSVDPRKPAAGLYGIGAGFLELVYGMGDPLKTYEEMRQAWERRRRMGGRQAAWGAKTALKPGIWERRRPADFAIFCELPEGG